MPSSVWEKFRPFFKNSSKYSVAKLKLSTE